MNTFLEGVATTGIIASGVAVLVALTSLLTRWFAGLFGHTVKNVREDKTWKYWSGDLVMVLLKPALITIPLGILVAFIADLFL